MVACKCDLPKSRHGQEAGNSRSQTSLQAGFRVVWGGVAGSEREPAGRLQLALDLSPASGACHRSGGSIHASPVAARPARCYIG